jgi:hypothetical protein
MSLNNFPEFALLTKRVEELESTWAKTVGNLESIHMEIKNLVQIIETAEAEVEVDRLGELYELSKYVLGTVSVVAVAVVVHMFTYTTSTSHKWLPMPI